MHLYIIRHGETDLNKLGVVQGKGIDSDINAEGEAQAEQFYAMYKDVAFDFIFTSTLKRTHQTVKPFLVHTPSLWIQFSELDEFSWGDHEGMPPTPKSMEIYYAMIDAWKRNDLQARIPNGESAQELYDRLHRFLEKLALYPGENILICTHGRTLKALITLLDNIPYHQMEQNIHHNTCLYLYEYTDESFKKLLSNDLSHLKI
jgi:broad specificity phosphatase PhoE